MSNNSTTEAPYFDLGLGMPLWVVIVWAAAAVLILAMVILIIYVCYTRKSTPPRDRMSEDAYDERRRSIATFDNYPQGYIDELHSKQPITKQLFPQALVHNMRIPRAVEVRISDASKNGKDYMPQHNVPEVSRVSFEELGFHGYEYERYDDEDDFNELHPTRRINLSRDASFKASNISEESKAKQLYRERMLVNELREKIRREKRIDEEDRS